MFQMISEGNPRYAEIEDGFSLTCGKDTDRWTDKKLAIVLFETQGKTLEQAQAAGNSGDLAGLVRGKLLLPEENPSGVSGWLDLHSLPGEGWKAIEQFFRSEYVIGSIEEQPDQTRVILYTSDPDWSMEDPVKAGPGTLRYIAWSFDTSPGNPLRNLRIQVADKTHRGDLAVGIIESGPVVNEAGLVYDPSGRIAPRHDNDRWHVSEYKIYYRQTGEKHRFRRVNDGYEPVDAAVTGNGRNHIAELAEWQQIGWIIIDGNTIIGFDNSFYYPDLRSPKEFHFEQPLKIHGFNGIHVIAKSPLRGGYMTKPDDHNLLFYALSLTPRDDTLTFPGQKKSKRKPSSVK